MSRQGADQVRRRSDGTHARIIGRDDDVAVGGELVQAFDQDEQIANVATSIPTAIAATVAVRAGVKVPGTT